MTPAAVMPPAAPRDMDAIMRAREHRTAIVQKGIWREHAAANRGRIVYQASRLWKDVNSKTGVLIAAGPSLAQSIPDLRDMDRDTHEIVAVDMALGYLLSEGVIPDYVISADASQKIARTLEVETPGAGLPLLLCVTAHPDTAKSWTGPIYWFAQMSDYYDGDAGEYIQRDHQLLTGISSFLVPGGNVSSLGLSFLLGVRASPRVLLYGHDFCWTDDATFYCGAVQADLAGERLRSESEAGTVLKMEDVAGREVKTNASLLHFARWYQEQMQRYPGVIDNRTPVTILPREA